MSRISRFWRSLAWGTGLVVAFSVAPLAEQTFQSEKFQAGKFTPPRFPSYLKNPSSVTDLMPAARSWARNRTSFLGAGLGAVEKGETVLLVTNISSDENVMEAIRRALEERGVKAIVRPNYEFVGVTKQEAQALQKARIARETGGYGNPEFEVAGWIESTFADPEAVKKWLREKNPSLVTRLWPQKQAMPPAELATAQKLRNDKVGPAIRAFIEKNTDVDALYWGRGGFTFIRQHLYPHHDKFRGILLGDTRWELLSEVGQYPSDVWVASEEKTVEAAAFTDQIKVTDPEGTNLVTNLSEELARRWARGIYHRAHLYLFPNQATGRFGYSVVDYPQIKTGEGWIPREPIARAEGVLAATTGGDGMMPRWEVHVKNGFVVDVKGGGTYGEAFREMLKYPGLNGELTYPYHKTPGFWYLWEMAMGSNPKFFRDLSYLDEGGRGTERARSGALHFGWGVDFYHGPDKPEAPTEFFKFAAQHNVPRSHSMHTYHYLTTIQLRIRGAGKFVSMTDKGRMISLDDPAVRAIASRYGNPDRILAEDWYPDIPGINTPGSYEEYAKDPWKHEKAVIDKILKGTYEGYYPTTASKSQ